MLTFKTIKYKNFLSTGNVFTKFDLDKHKTTLICGDNGAGKSAVLDALCFVLYNKSFRKVNKPQLINSINNKEMMVEIEFSVNSNDYHVIRGMKPTVFEIYRNGELIEPPADSKDYQTYLESSILRMSYKTFVQVVLLGSANFIPFMQLPAAGRREIIEGLLDIELFSTMNVIVKDSIKAMDEQLRDMNAQEQILTNTIKLNIQHRKKVEALTSETVTEKENEVYSLLDEIEKHKENRAPLIEEETQQAEKLGKLDIVNAKIKETEGDLFDLEYKLKDIDEEIAFLFDNQECKSCGQEIHEDFRVAQSEKLHAQADDISEKRDVKAGELEKLRKMVALMEAARTRRNELSRQISEINAAITFNMQRIDKLNSDIKKIEETSIEVYDDSKDREEFKDLLKRKKILLKEKEIDEIAGRLLKDSGIKSQVIKQYIPIINQLVNANLAKLEFFCMFEFDENFDEVIKSRYRDVFSYDSFSQGERMRIDLSLLFAFRELSKMRNSSPCNILVLDEVMDSSLDAAGTDEFLNIIQEFADNNNIIVISHKHHQINDKFDQTIRIEKKKNFSRKVS